MSLKVEIISENAPPKLLGIMDTGRAHPFTNFNPDGSRELIVFRCNKEGTSTEVFKTKNWRRVVDPGDLDLEEFEHEITLNPGEDYYINSTKNGDSTIIKSIRFVQDDEPVPDILTRLSDLANPQKLN